MSLINTPYQVMAMHDMCAYGRSSLTAVMPVLSALQCQVSPLPTALLSSHLGFANPSILNLSEELKKILNHWKTLSLKFECFYSGYLASPDQVSIALEYLQEFQVRFIFVDPVLGDGGAFYHGFDRSQSQAMLRLLSHAHMISPNLTEACLLLDETPATYLEEEKIKIMLKKLSDLGPDSVCITGVPTPAGKQIHTYAYSRKDGESYRISSEYYNANLHGTGDSFASVLVGLTLAGTQFSQALMSAQSYLNMAVRMAVEQNIELCIEPALQSLCAGSQSVQIEYLS